MMSWEQLRRTFQTVGPRDLLQHLSAIKSQRQPLLTVVMASGHSFKGYLVNSSGGDDPNYCFSLQIEHEGDGAADLCYAAGSRIEAVTVWNVDDHATMLPARQK